MSTKLVCLTEAPFHTNVFRSPSDNESTLLLGSFCLENFPWDGGYLLSSGMLLSIPESFAAHRRGEVWSAFHAINFSSSTPALSPSLVTLQHGVVAGWLREIVLALILYLDLLSSSSA